MPHAARPLRSWLIFDVSQMKTSLLVAFSLAVAIGRALAAEGTTLEKQFRADVASFIRAKAQQAVQAEAQEKAVEQMVSDVKNSFPSVLVDAANSDPPSDEALRRALGDLDRIGGGAPRSVLISFYAELWTSDRIGPQQRIIFERLARAIAERTQMQKKNG